MENFSIEIRQVINSERIIELQCHHFATSKKWVALVTVPGGCYTCSQQGRGRLEARIRLTAPEPPLILTEESAGAHTSQNLTEALDRSFIGNARILKTFTQRKRIDMPNLNVLQVKWPDASTTNFNTPTNPLKIGREPQEMKWDPVDIITGCRPQPIWTQAKHT